MKETEYVLKPCPFCGGKAKMKFGFPNQQRKSLKMVFIQCSECKCKTETIYQQPHGAFDDCKQYAAAQWNHRI